MNLVVLLVNGEETEHNPGEALDWLRKAAAQGSPEAEQALAALGDKL